MAKKKKIKEPKIDSFSDADKKRIRTALRQVWSWSHPHRLVRVRCLLPSGFSKCEKCKKKCPKVFVDHIKRVGEIDNGVIKRMFVPSSKLQGLCNKCHNMKTKIEKMADFK